MRAVFLCGRDELSKIVFSHVRRELDVVAVICERKPSPFRLLKRRIRRVGLWETCGQLLFILTNKFTVLLDRQRIAELREHFAPTIAAYPQGILHAVESANSEQTISLVEAAKPDLIVLNGTRILSKKFLSRIRCPIINTHVGITPRYRGVHGGYWALRRGEREYFGSTVHLVDAGIDTGDVLYHAYAQPGPADTINTYPFLQIEAALPLISRAIADLGHGQLRAFKVGGPSNLYYHPTFWSYWYYRLIHAVK